MTISATGQLGLSHDANGDFNYILVILSYQSTCNAPKLNYLLHRAEAFLRSQPVLS